MILCVYLYKKRPGVIVWQKMILSEVPLVSNPANRDQTHMTQLSPTTFLKLEEKWDNWKRIKSKSYLEWRTIQTSYS